MTDTRVSPLLVPDPSGDPPDQQESCAACKAPLHGDSIRLREPWGDVRWMHGQCWGRVLKEREEHWERQQAREVERRVGELKRRCAALLSGRLGEHGQQVCSPPCWPHARFENLEWRRRTSRKIVGAVERWDPRETSTLLLAAPTGSGKSSALLARLHRDYGAAIARAQKGDENVAAPGFIWASGPELAVARRNVGFGSEAPLIAHALKTEILILDELGYEPLTGIPFELVDHRYRAQAITVVTTGLTAAAFAERYGDALYRRLAEGGAVVEDFPG